MGDSKISGTRWLQTWVALCVMASGCGAELASDRVDEDALKQGVVLSASAVSPGDVDLGWTTILTNVSQYTVKRGVASNSLTTSTALSGTTTRYSDTSVSAG